MISTRVISDISQLEAIVEAWGGLVARTDTSELMLTPSWLVPWWQVYGRSQGRQLRVLTCWEGERLVGLLPTLTRRHWHRRVLPLQRLEPLGSGERESEETCSVYLGPLVEAGAEASVLPIMAAALKQGKLGAWDELVLPHMRRESVAAVSLASALREPGIDVEVQEGRDCPIVPLPSSFDGYLEALSPKRRYNVRRSIRDLEKYAGGTLALKVVERVSELELGKRILLKLHRERWLSEGESGAFESWRFRAFHDTVMLSMLNAGTLELMWLEARGEPIAALYTMVWGNRIYAYQMGRKCDMPKGLRPGIAVHALAIKRGIELGRTEYDFGSGNSRYKSDLATSYRSLVTLRATRLGALQSARVWLDEAEGRARQWKRRWQQEAAARTAVATQAP